MAKDKRKGKVRRKIRKRLEAQVKNKIQEREVILDQLALLDAELDGIDDVIIRIDAKIPDLVNEVNDKVDALKAAYDARIAAKCLSNLKWEPIENDPPRTFGRGAQFDDVQNFQVVNTAASTTPKIGVKYYKKEQDRDYGTNIIQKFVGFITAGHDVMAVVNANPDIDSIEVGDFLTDSFVGPETFQIGDLPKVTGIGTTTLVRVIGEIGGSIGAGETIFANTGIGSTSTVPIGRHFVSAGHFFPDTVVVGFGTTSISKFVVDPNNGVSTAFTYTVPSYILSKAAFVGIPTDIPEEIGVGIVSTFPSFELDEEAVQNSSDRAFVAYRVDPDPNDEYRANAIDANRKLATKSPVDPIEIGILTPSTYGTGHQLKLTTNGDPDPSPGVETWESQKDTTGIKVNGEQVDNDHPEPKVGGGVVTYYEGVPLFPTIVENGERTNYLGAQTQYATLGQTTDIGVGSTDNLNGTTHGSTLVRGPLPSPSDATCDALDAAIVTAQNELDAIKAENEPRIRKFIKKTKTLRKLRDELQLQAWGLLQSAAFVRGSIEDLLQDNEDLDNEEYDEFDPD